MVAEDHSSPLSVTEFEGVVLLDGGRPPIAAALTPEAAIETAHRLVAVAQAALVKRMGGSGPASR